jgi:DnaJ-class molecular chaperone
MSESFYSILEVPETASSEDIKKSYRKLSMLNHPDKNRSNPDATAKFQKISEAYETLGDIEKKREYDMRNNNPFAKMMGGHSFHQGGGGHQGNPMDDLFSNLFGMQFGQGMPPGMMHPGMMPQGMPPGFNSPNIRVFHNGMPVNMGVGGLVNGLQKPTPIIKTVAVPIDKILTGTTMPVDIERWIIQENNKTFENETIYVTVPKGIDEGEIIILKDKGNFVNEECKGDVKICIKIDNNTEFRRSGLDLLFDKTISIKEALCGFNFELKYITGKTYTITNNSGNIISNGYSKTIPNMGFSRDQHTGNLIIYFNIKFPEKISDEVMEQLKALDF